MSSRNVDESVSDSIGFDQMLASVFVHGYDDMSSAEKYQAALTFDEPVRHVAHMAEFAVLGALLALVFLLLRRRLWMALLIGAAYGIFDEVHQIFVSGRGFQISDICFDVAGVGIGALTVWGIGKLREKRKGRLQV